MSNQRLLLTEEQRALIGTVRNVGYKFVRPAADPDADRVDGPAAQDGQEVVARLLEAQPVGHELPVIPGQLHGARVAEEVRGVEEVDVEGVALDPLAAVEQPAERADGRVDLDPPSRDELSLRERRRGRWLPAGGFA